MPGLMLHLGAEVICFHGGQAEPIVPNPRVLLSGLPAVNMDSPYVVAGCCLPPPPIADGPCVIGEWVTGTTRVFSEGLPFIVDLGEAVCELSGTGLLPLASQIRVTAE